LNSSILEKELFGDKNQPLTQRPVSRSGLKCEVAQGGSFTNPHPRSNRDFSARRGTVSKPNNKWARRIIFALDHLVDAREDDLAAARGGSVPD